MNSLQYYLIIFFSKLELLEDKHSQTRDCIKDKRCNIGFSINKSKKNIKALEVYKAFSSCY